MKGGALLSRYFLPQENLAFVPNHRLRYLSLSVACLGIAFILGIIGLYLMPESVTHWTKQKFGLISWLENVHLGPVFDNDLFVFNWVLHPYFGAIYYMQARVAGYRFLTGVVFTALVSTFFWEYGLEAFVEIPSIQDLICTPTLGPLVGEIFYRISQRLQQPNKLPKIFTECALFFLDFIGFSIQKLGFAKACGICNKNAIYHQSTPKC